MARVCSSILFFILSHIFILLIAQVTSQPEFLNNFCENDRGNYTRNSTYEANLNHLLSTLPSQDGNDYGFYNLSYGNSSDKVYTIALCRGDAKPDACRSCLNDSTLLLPQRCRDQKEAVGWYDNCMLRYSNRSMFGIVETSQIFYMWSVQNVTDADGFYEKLRTLINQLKNQAAAGDSLRKFATGNDTTPEFKTIYALVQCTPDLSKEQCNNCLDSVFGYIPQCCGGKKGGRVIGPSCNVRYEDYLFYDSTANPPPTSPPTVSPPPPTSTNTTPTQGNESNTSRTVIIVAVSTSALFLVVLIISVCVFFGIKMAKKKEEKITNSNRSYILKDSLLDVITALENPLSDFVQRAPLVFENFLPKAIPYFPEESPFTFFTQRASKQPFAA
ncbi:hypothetical protein L484_006313 [Morus notabilis]|uniref:Gnk2-homologous domain-containing protein n=1 Tax=Morus notabilis TaxID=981085 RepID=W9QIU3_9ROSA|nr:hypothetical protein L484_006313 [Morus notabilis]